MRTLWLALLVAFAPALAGCKGRFKLPADARFVEQLAMSPGLVCAKMKNGSARCFGDGESVAVGGIPGPVVEVAVGGAQVAALTTDGSAYVGEGTGGLARVDGIQGRHVARGSTSTCALSAEGEVRCWGAGAAAPGALHGVSALAAGGDATCAILADRKVTCWGRVPGRGEVGVTPIDGLADVIAVAVNDTHGCAVRAWGGVACWGRNEEGELGDGTFTDRAQPVEVGGLPVPARQVAVGLAHTCALLADGTVRCWGANALSQLADGTTAHRTSPATVQGLFEVQAVVAAGDATCARFGDGSARCWGGLRLPKTAGDRVVVPTEVRW